MTLPRLEGAGGTIVTPSFHIQKSEPVIINVDEFRYSYTCKRCSNSWSEKRVEKHVEEAGPARNMAGKENL
jgi:hypothetical protein